MSHLSVWFYQSYDRLFSTNKSFHSTMFLLILHLSPHPVTTTVFTFHYVSTYTCVRVNIKIFFISIYIPLCFYLYALTAAPPLVYGSFTFHYVSTYTSLNNLCQYDLSHLHSTMFLLIRVWSLLKLREATKFTFHYVSTYTVVSGR